MLKPVTHVIYGTDPELFLEQYGKIIGSERAIPPVGLLSRAHIKPIVVRDGVQIEFNPPASSNLRVLGANIAACFDTVQSTLKRLPGITLNYEQVVEVSREELDSLTEASRALGCLPSKNIYGFPEIDVPKDYQFRSAGGHLHFGLQHPVLNKLYNQRPDLVSPFDILVGNFSVLVDRNPQASERRKNYGRAGEYRDENPPNEATGEAAPHHGIEYRTLSNFWLRSYTLTSFVFGMGQIAIAAVAQPALEKELVNSVDIGVVVKAIQTNDFELALDNFYAVRSFLAKYLPSTGFVLSPDSLDKFESWVRGVNANGLGAYFPELPHKNWISGSKEEFNTFLARI